MRSAVLLLLVTISGCGTVLPFDPEPAAEPQAVTDCLPPFAFEGTTTLTAIGLGDIQAADGDANRRGSIRITQDTVRWEEFAPPGVPALVAEGQLLCVTWADGSGMSTMLTEPFEPRDDGAAADGPTARLRIIPVIVGVVVLLLAGASWLAFRRESG